MTDRDRLIELHHEAGVEWDNYLFECIDNNKMPSKTYDEFHADYLLANGVIVPPCKVGDTVYYIHETFYDNEYMKAKEGELNFSDIVKIVERPNCKTNLMLERIKFDWLLMDGWLKGDVFLTKEEAEAELRKRSERKCPIKN